MLSEEFKEIDFQQENLPISVFQDVLEPKEEEKDFSQLQHSFLQNPLGREAKKSAKGRRKGDKNSKVKEKKVKEGINSEDRKRGHWSNAENKRYHWFLEIYHNHFIVKEKRRLDKIFKTMAIFIGTREAEQCRSHHQKMEKKYNTFANMILYLRNTHYNTEEVLPIEEDMLENGVEERATFIPASELVELNQQKKLEPPTPSVIKRDDIQMEVGYVMRDIRFENEHSYYDILGDHYQNHFELFNLLH